MFIKVVYCISQPSLRLTHIVQTTCSGLTPPRRTITSSPSPQKEDFKEVFPLMPLRANQVYRRGDRSQVDFKHRSDPGHLENLHYSSFGEIKLFLHIGCPVF